MEFGGNVASTTQLGPKLVLMAPVSWLMGKTSGSKSSLALVMSTSVRGMVKPAPALCAMQSSEPSVSSVTRETAAAVDSSDRVTSWRVSMPAASTTLTLDKLRADAKMPASLVEGYGEGGA